MKVFSKGYKEFELNDADGRFLGKLAYESWFSSKAFITT